MSARSHSLSPSAPTFSQWIFAGFSERLKWWELSCAIYKPFGSLYCREWVSLGELMDSFNEKWEGGEAELPCQELRLNRRNSLHCKTFLTWSLYIDLASGWPISFWEIHLLSNLFKLRVLPCHSLWQTSFPSDGYRWASVVSVTLLVFSVLVCKHVEERVLLCLQNSDNLSLWVTCVN